MPNKFTLPLSPSNSNQLAVFMTALGEPKMRSELKKQSLPQGPAELLAMVNDQKFKSLSKQVANTYTDYLGKRVSREGLEEQGQVLHDYIAEKYPSALGSLIKFGKTVAAKDPRYAALDPRKARLLRQDQATLHVVANVEAVVNAGVYANVAVATFVAVAAAAVVVVAAVVA